MKEIKMSGTVDKLTEDKHYRRVVLDFGGTILVRDENLTLYGQYNEGDKIVITISPLIGDEQYCVPKPTIEELKEYNLKINE